MSQGATLPLSYPGILFIGGEAANDCGAVYPQVLIDERYRNIVAILSVCAEALVRGLSN